MLTIFIPSYNHSKYIVECLINVQKINMPGKRVIIFDDASSDDSVQKIEHFIQNNDENSEITFIKKPKNLGVIDSLNRFLSMVTTEYVYLMASDDIAIAEGIEKLVKILQKNKDMKFIIGGGVNLFSDGTETKIYGKQHHDFFSLPPSEMIEGLFFDAPSPILAQSTVVRTAALIAIGGWFNQTIADDFEMFLKLFIKYPVSGVDFKYLPEVLCVRYRHHGENSYKNFERQLLMKVQTLESLAPENLKKRAIGYTLAFYFLYAIFKKQFKVLLKLWKITPISSWGWALVGVFRLIYLRICLKCKT